MAGAIQSCATGEIGSPHLGWHHDHRPRCAFQHGIGLAAEQDTTDAMVAAAADDNQVSTMFQATNRMAPNALDPSMPHEAIVAIDLTQWVGEGETRKTAVNGARRVAYFGELLFVVGPSGSGKTTMLSMLSGSLHPNAGTVIVNGADIWTLNTGQLADCRLHTIGVVFQDYHLSPRQTAAENVGRGVCRCESPVSHGDRIAVLTVRAMIR